MNDIIDVGATNDPRLAIVKSLLNELNKHDIIYCHWKSNEHVLPAVQGDTDLDVLFSENQQDQVRSILVNVGFRKFKAAWFVRYPYIEDYLAIDSESGKLVHVHTHFRLVLGEKMVKSYRLPWENVILEGRIWMQQVNIYASSEKDEFLLLLVRLALKIPFLHTKKFAKKQDSEDAKREFYWLKERVGKEELCQLSRKRLGSVSVTSIEALYDNGLTSEGIKQLSTAIRPEMNSMRRLSFLNSYRLRYTRWIFYNFSRVNKRLNLLPIANHRTFLGDGLIISLMGADGSGKSTQTKLLTQQLKKKLDTVFIYMGSGDGTSSFYVKLLKYTIRLFQPENDRKLNYKLSKTRISDLKVNQSPVKQVGKIVYALSLCIDKKAKLKNAQRIRRRGAIVICDRYPQIQCFGYNDGPLLGTYRTSKFACLRWIANFEKKQYGLCEYIKPNLVIKLITDTKVLHQRRSDEMSFERLSEKQEGIVALKFADDVKVIHIDAAMEISEVLKVAMSEIGKFLTIETAKPVKS